MSNFFSNIHSSLSKYVDPSLLDQANLESVLTDDRLKTLEGVEDAKELDEAELLEILLSLEEQGEANGVISQIIDSIERSLNAGEVKQIQVDTLSENEVNEVKPYLEDPEKFAKIKGDFANYPLEMQKQVLQYCFTVNDMDKLNKLLLTLPTDDAHDLIVHIASHGT